jgi:4a-hydroxytetrahydrobiopterin dehydratase
MAVLAELKCTTCTTGDDAMNEQEIKAFLKDVPDWELVRNDSVDKLRRLFEFRDYSSAVDFTVQVAALAETADHHPSIQLEWGKTIVTWWTHTVNGLHKNDFIMAAKTSRAYKMGKSGKNMN